MPRKTRKIRMEVLEDRTLLNASLEIIASITSSFSNPSSTPQELSVIDDTMYFNAFDVNNGRELWKSDGTSAGTMLVKDINPGSSSSYPRDFTDVNGTLFFIAYDGTNGNELWKSDGTSGGTMLLKDIRPGSSSSYPYYLTEVNGTLFFSAYDGTNGRELWKSDGTSAGTMLVKDINPGSDSSSPSSLTEVNGTLFFSATLNSSGNGGLFKLGPVLFGTSGEDTITVKVNNGFDVNINGRSYYYPAGELSIVGSGGQDSIVVTGTSADEVLFADPHTFDFSGSDFRITGSGVEFLTVRGNGGDDVATLLDSAGNERVVAKVNNTFVRDLARTFTQRVVGFGDVTLKSSGAITGFDLANLFDSVGSDTFTGNSTDASMVGPGYRVSTEGYDRNVARSTSGGLDVAILNGTSEGNENFTARVTNNPSNNFGILRNGPGAPLAFLNRAIGFSSVRANSGGGNDKGFLFGGAGDDDFQGTSTRAQLEGSGYQFTASNFNRVNTTVTQGGNDEAILFDGVGNDRLNGSGNTATLKGASNSFTHATKGFENVIGNARNGGTDQLDLAIDIAFNFFELGTWEVK